jgi:hypothetical protein
MVHFVFRQVADFFRVIDASLCGDRFRALLPDAVDRRQADPEAFLRRKVNTCDTCHSLFSLISFHSLLAGAASCPASVSPIPGAACASD